MEHFQYIRTLEDVKDEPHEYVYVNDNGHLWHTKLATFFLLLVSTLVFGIIPIQVIKFIRKRTNGGGERLSERLERALSLLNCFAGGVFFGTTMLHLIPESREGVEDFLEDAGITTNFALSECIISFGFFVVMFVEHVVMVCRVSDASRGQTVSVLNFHDAASSSGGNMLTSNPTYGAISENETDGLLSRRTRSRQDPNEDSHMGHSHGETSQLGTLRSFTLLLALSLHTIFEGIAIGLEKSHKGVWDLFLAIVVHKSVIAFSMGIQFAENLKTYGRAILFIVLFAIMSPIGIGIGSAVYAASGENGSVDGAAPAILQGIAAGTFIYVTFFEVLHHELSRDHCLLKVLLTILGFGAMALLNLFNGEPKDD